LGYRPFGRFRQVGGYHVGDQWPEPPEALRQSIDEPAQLSDYNRVERAIYRWLAHPRLLPRKVPRMGPRRRRSNVPSDE
jgi:hypothetical protein